LKERPPHNDQMMPVLFIGHGSPMNVFQANEFTRSLTELGRSLPKPKAIMVISAHWLTEGTRVTCTEKPKTIHDFYGFPEELYRINYPSPGAPSHAKAVIDSVKTVEVKCDTDWGLDHASWTILKHMYPEADIPTFEMSLDYSFNEWNPKPLRPCVSAWRSEKERNPDHRQRQYCTQPPTNRF
jgi:4,5-DOPA dioxygenase extradiol